MNDLDNLPDYSLWSQDFTPDEVTILLKVLCDNFEKDLEILRKKFETERESWKPGTGLQTWHTFIKITAGTILENCLYPLHASPNLRLLPNICPSLEISDKVGPSANIRGEGDQEI